MLRKSILRNTSFLNRLRPSSSSSSSSSSLSSSSLSSSSLSSSSLSSSSLSSSSLSSSRSFFLLPFSQRFAQFSTTIPTFQQTSPLRCTGYAADCEFDLFKIHALFLKQKLGKCRVHYHDRVPNLLHLRRVDGTDIYIYSYGAAVFWGMEQDQELSHWQTIIPMAYFSNNYYSKQVDLIKKQDKIKTLMNLQELEGGMENLREKESFEYIIEEKKIEGSNSIKNNLIHLTPESLEISKLGISFGIAQAVKLNVFENALDDALYIARHLTDLIVKQGSVRLQVNSVGKMTGELILLKMDSVSNPHLNDLPDSLWEYEKGEELYTEMRQYMNIKQRLNVFGDRLDLATDLYKMLSEERHHIHSLRLEVIIAALIVIEILIEIFPKHRKYQQEPKEEKEMKIE